MARYNVDSSLKTLGDKIIAAHHPNLKILKIAYMFREEASIDADGKVTAGMAVKVSDRDWTLHKYDAVIEIAKDVWEEADDRFRNALMDHELSHLALVMDEAGTPKMDEITARIKVRIRDHDITEFEGVLERHGAYHQSLRQFLLAFAKNKETAKKAKRAGMTGGMSDGSSS